MYKLRFATNNDYDFLYNLLKVTLKQYYIETFGKWDDDIERAYFDKSFKEIEYQIITLNEQDTGCIAKKNNPNEIFIHEIQILPKYQNKWIGSMIITSIIEESEKLNIPIKLEVIKSNSKAIQFYRRMNFYTYGKNESHIFMIREPNEINNFK